MTIRNFDVTKNGTRYLIEWQRGRQILLFPWGPHAKVLVYAPTEKQILDTCDPEIIDLYRKIDYENEEYM